MPNNSQTILSSSTHPGDSSVQTATGEKYQGDGYYSRSDGLHTIQYSTTEFIGTIDILGTLAIEPTDNDWFTISAVSLISENSSSSFYTGNFIYNFVGNYVWIKCKISNWSKGSINSIKLNN